MAKTMVYFGLYNNSKSMP